MTAQLIDLTPHLPTSEVLIPGMRPAVATYEVKRPWWTKPPARHTGLAWGGALACLVPVSVAIAQILTGGAL
jgi:hypothetical protein